MARKAWLNFTGCFEMGLRSEAEVIAYLDEWQRSYADRHPEITITNVEDEVRGIAWPNLGIGRCITGRRSFLPVVNGKPVTTQNELHELSEDVDVYGKVVYAKRCEEAIFWTSQGLLTHYCGA